MGHLSKLQDEYGEKGLTVIGLTSEDRRTNLRYLVHQDPGFTYKIAIGGASGYETPRFPWSVLIAPDGTIAWQDSPGRMSERKHLRPLIAKVVPPNEADRQVRAAKLLAVADDLIADGLFLRAEQTLQSVRARYPKTDAAKSAAQRRDALLDGDVAQREYDAQKAIAKLVGGSERPDPTGKRAKHPERTASKLGKLAAEWADSAPRSARLAREWQDIFLVPWK